MKYRLSFILCFCLVIFFQSVRLRADIYSKARIIKIEDIVSGSNGSSQNIRLKITGGKYKNRVVDVKNYLWDDKHYNTFPKENNIVVVRIHETDGMKLEYVSISGYPRDKILFSFFVVFLVVVFLICGKKGFRLAFSLLINIAILWRIMVPMLKAGFNPLFVCVVSALAAAAIILLLILGFNKKYFSALSCVTAGVLFSGFTTILFIRWSDVSGNFIDGSRMLLVAARMISDWHITKLRSLVAGGVIIASLGTVTDIVVDVITGIYSVSEAIPGITRRELFSSGMNIGRDVLGGMLGSLLLVFTAMSLVSSILYSALGIPFLRIVNWEFFAVTVLQAFISSMSFVVSVPITVTLTSFILSKRGGVKHSCIE